MALFSRWMAGLVLAALVLLALAFAAPLGWPFELASHFRPYVCLLAPVLGLGAWAAGRPRLAAGVCALAALSAVTLPPVPHFVPPARTQEAGLTILWANLWHSRDALGRTLDYARQIDADIILLGEVPAAGADLLAAARDYPHRLDPGKAADPAALTSHVIALSRRPLLRPRVIAAPEGPPRPMLSFAVREGAGELTILALHTFAPPAPQSIRWRDRMIEAAAAHATAPFLLAGDLNATPWSPGMRVLPGKRLGAPLFERTWSALPEIPFGLPIDHMYVSDDVEPLAYRLSPPLGSDHRALIATVRLRAGA